MGTFYKMLTLAKFACVGVIIWVMLTGAPLILNRASPQMQIQISPPGIEVQMATTQERVAQLERRVTEDELENRRLLASERLAKIEAKLELLISLLAPVAIFIFMSTIESAIRIWKRFRDMPTGPSGLRPLDPRDTDEIQVGDKQAKKR